MCNKQSIDYKISYRGFWFEIIFDIWRDNNHRVISFGHKITLLSED